MLTHFWSDYFVCLDHPVWRKHSLQLNFCSLLLVAQVISHDISEKVDLSQVLVCLVNNTRAPTAQSSLIGKETCGIQDTLFQSSREVLTETRDKFSFVIPADERDDAIVWYQHKAYHASTGTSRQFNDLERSITTELKNSRRLTSLTRQ